MKKKSIKGKHILFDIWKTPVQKSDQLWLERQIFLENYIYFFFRRNHDSPKNEYHVLKIHGSDPIRFIEEGLGSNIVGPYVTKPKAKTRESTKYRTFKIWNTPFAKEVFGNLPITKEEYKGLERSDKVFQYLIYTQDAWIEFIAFDPPDWKFHKDIKLTDLVIKYLKEASLD